ncbi:MAG TPA: hypothetical protein VFK41_02075, partial [Nocardioidaceae bacterium]|nr:hypothetical protein [Nocardioidaceae bacterium]
MGDTATAALDSTQAVADALVKNVLENRRAGNDRLMLAAAWADMHQVPPGVKDGEHPGAEGTPEVARFAVEELSVLIEKHVHAGRQVVADALNLRHRHPRLWARVQAYEVEAWVAAQTARRVAAAGLSAVQARWVDEETAGALAELPVGRYFTVLDAKVIEADQALAEARRGEAMQRRFVRKTRLNEHGLKGLYAMATFTGVDTVYATVDRAASILML